MPDNEEPTTELPPVQPAPVAAVAPPVVVTPAPAVAEHKGHSTTKVLLAAGAGALVVFLIAAAGIIGFAVGKHANHEGGPRPMRVERMMDSPGGRGGPGSQGMPGNQGMQGNQGMPGMPGLQGNQDGPGTGRGPGGMWNQQGQQGGSQSAPQGQQGTLPQFPGMPGQQSGGMMGQLPSQR